MNIRILVASIALLGACAPSLEDEAAMAEEGDSSAQIDVQAQAVIFNDNCNQAQRDALSGANLGVLWLSNDLLGHWNTTTVNQAKSRWFGSGISAASAPTLSDKLTSIRNVAAAGGPAYFACLPSCQADMFAYTFYGQNVIALCPAYWGLPHDSGDNVEPRPGGQMGSRVGVLAHEYAHYAGVAPLDIATGPTHCASLVKKGSVDVVRNADNWRMFIMHL